MITKLSFLIILFSIVGCTAEHSDLEICFEKMKNRINSDSLLNKIKNSPIDTNYGPLMYRLGNELRSDSNSKCSMALKKFLLENSENSRWVNSLIFFQQFQAYLKHEKFNHSKARDIALKFEAKWK